jgi:hypothetical protein
MGCVSVPHLKEAPRQQGHSSVDESNAGKTNAFLYLLTALTFEAGEPVLYMDLLMFDLFLITRLLTTV